MIFDLENECDIIKQKRVGSVVVVLYKKTRKSFSILVARGINAKTVGTWGSKKYAMTKFSTVVSTTQVVHDVMDKKPETILRKKENITTLAG